MNHWWFESTWGLYSHRRSHWSCYATVFKSSCFDRVHLSYESCLSVLLYFPTENVFFLPTDKHLKSADESFSLGSNLGRGNLCQPQQEQIASVVWCQILVTNANQYYLFACSFWYPIQILSDILISQPFKALLTLGCLICWKRKPLTGSVRLPPPDSPVLSLQWYREWPIFAIGLFVLRKQWCLYSRVYPCMFNLGYPCRFLFVKYCNSFHHCRVEDNKAVDQG